MTLAYFMPKSGNLNTVMCLSIRTPKNNKFSICSEWKINYFLGVRNFGLITAYL